MKFEYKILYDVELARTDYVETAEVKINKLGNEGWELVSCHRACETSKDSGVDRNTFRYVFKRPAV